LNRAVFLDRDGVINKTVVVDGKPYPPSSVKELEIFEGVDQSIDRLIKKGFEIVVVTNQPDLARGKTDLKAVEDIHNQIRQKTKIKNFFICPHDELDQCICRKPKTGLLIQAKIALDLDLQNSFMIGDRWKDIQAGQRAGCKCFFINFSYSEKLPNPPYIEVKSLTEATKFIIEDNK
jgi:D-glycero-D-manno-heptose 1,7-bisphosphate phosphatase